MAMKKILWGGIKIFTHITHVCDGKDRIEHFPLLAMLVAFMFHMK